ncbi:hypothetical protein F3Y22_tig00111366pilonHSYRG00133 [Hibiscus syriacus]|uniref:Phospholipase/carboxylesterase/thioesterase domain-containing protein n=1 Tax=Hibiscus syriacus TaxID=106335 RepID=A0A6A2YN70_HIBSY|nr:hypothetical protein F3Y22_tig00111366pilonHSYRG00133 [Hibiscus syriacus]
MPRKLILQTCCQQSHLMLRSESEALAWVLQCPLLCNCFCSGKVWKWQPYSINLRAIVGLSGWLPASRCVRNKIEVSHEASRRAASLPIMLFHGTCDDVVPYKYGEISAHSLSVAGFRNLSFKNYEGIGHYTVPKEMNVVCNWLRARLGLEGPR